MKSITKNIFLSPPMIFIAYVLVFSGGMIGFRFLFLLDPPPLPHYIRSWRWVQGLLNFISFFPALVMSGLVIPFGLKRNFQEEVRRFSPNFLKQVKSLIIIAIIALVLYGFLFFLIFPMARDYESHLRYGGYIFKASKEKAQGYAEKEAWPEAAQFIAICEQLWPNSPEIAPLQREVLIGLDEWRVAQIEAQKEAWVAPSPQEELISMYSGLPGQQNPINAAEALAMADLAIREERYYDAHWLATLGNRLAKRGSLEQVHGIRLAKQSWDAVTALGPNTRESRAYALYRQKQEGYEALVSEDWIRAYYIFRELSIKTPGDPDVTRFSALSEKGTMEIAFFTDEIELTLGEVLTGSLFSFPRKDSAGKGDGRMVLRISSLATAQNASYGIGIDLMAFNEAGNLQYRVQAPYAKILPITLDSGPQVLIMLRALDRLDKDKQNDYIPVWTGPDHSAPGETRITLDITYEDFLLLSKLRQGLEPLSIGELLAVADRVGSYGYISEFFHAEIISRVAEVSFFFPLMILAIMLGWIYRTRQRTSALIIPMLVVLPLVFSGLVFLYRNVIDILSIGLVMLLGFPFTIILFIGGTILIFIFSLILLAAQGGEIRAQE